MAIVKWESGSAANVLTTELNSLAQNAKKISAAIDNTSDLYLFDDVELLTGVFSSAPPSGAMVELYSIPSIDGTNYGEGSDTIAPPPSSLVGIFNIRAATASQRHIIRGIPVVPGKFKYLIINKSGQAFASSGNTLRRLPYRYQTTN